MTAPSTSPGPEAPELRPLPPPAPRRLAYTLPFVILGLGLAVYQGLVWLAPTPEKQPLVVTPETVQVQLLAPTRIEATVHGTGTVSPAQQVSVVPEVSGRLVAVSEQLHRGGRLARGEMLARIDDRDYRAMVTQETSRVARAELALSVEQAQGSTAARAWEVVDGSTPDPESLALRAPQLQVAQADLDAARASLARAKLALERATLRAPFDAIVLDEQVDVGQVVGPGQPIAVLASANVARVAVWVSMDELTWITLPDADTPGSEVTVTQRVEGEADIVRKGVVVGTGGQLDPQTRAAEVLVDIASPLQDDAGGLPLLSGAFVSIRIHGRTLQDVLVVPRDAVLDGARVWTVDAQDQLAQREVTLGWRDDTQAVIRSGLEPGERVVVSPLAVAVAGTPVRVVQGEP
jgi:RND family efflux transporter MFP subunit